MLSVLTKRLPIISWVPTYSPKWLFSDIAAGITIAVLLIPQSLAYAKIATIPGEYGVLSSWAPPALYALMGTSKDLSSGPTSIMGILTSKIIVDLSQENLPPQVISGTVSFVVGIYSLIVALFRLEYVLDFVSTPVLVGFVSSAGLTIIIGQLPSIFGETGIGSGTITMLRDVVIKLPEANLPTLSVGLFGVVFLVAAQEAGKRWGKHHKLIWLLSTSRNTVFIFVSTLISFSLNKNRELPLWELTDISRTTIKSPHLPSLTLAGKVASRSIAVFLALAIENLAVCRFFARKNNYTVDDTQELYFLGISNFFNGFFPTMATGGAFSRTAVNSDSGVKSPLGGLITSIFVVLSIYFFTPALQWIPRATLSAVIIVAVWHIISPPSTFYLFYRTSRADFLSSLAAFFGTLLVSVEVGMACGLAISLISLIPHLLSRPKETSPPHTEARTDTLLFTFDQSLLFYNTYWAKKTLLEAVQRNCHTTALSNADERHWNSAAMKTASDDLAPLLPRTLRTVILDFSRVSQIDATGLQSIGEAQKDILAILGPDAVVEFMCDDQKILSKFRLWNLK